MVIGEVSVQLPLEQQWMQGTPMMQGEAGCGVNHAAGNVSCTPNDNWNWNTVLLRLSVTRGKKRNPLYSCAQCQN